MDEASRDRFRQVDEIFDAALDVAAHERDAFVVARCGVDVELLHRVRTLLDAHQRSGDFLNGPAVELAAVLLDDPMAATVAPERVGGFRIVREIGHGGMGVVYLAEREGAEFEQRVALKLVRNLGAGDALLRRFVEERRILALLEHPGIAHLIDGGLTSDGVPWFAMEFVEGEPIDAFCDNRRLTVDQRLDLIASVCEAVQYAHEHLVIHRDLKPSNILVREDGQLKLLDFGIAKLLDPLAMEGGSTQTGVVALTPEYAAPEQVRGQAVSTATDTYALGVLLFVLLTGRRPYEVRGLSPGEMERVVCESQPPRPSAVAAEPLRRQIGGDIDLIVLKALHKEPARRYSTASALRDDIQRLRAGLPVAARPDSVAYRAAKFARRNRVAVGASVITLVALVAATAFSMTQASEANRQRDAALREVQRQNAMTVMQDVLAIDSRDGEGRHLVPEQRIALAAAVLEQQFAGEPWLIAEGLANLASRLYDLGDRAGERAMLARGRVFARGAKLPKQLAVLDCMRANSLTFDDHLDSARSAIKQSRSTLTSRDARDSEVATTCLDAEGQLLLAEGHPDSAITLFRRGLALADSGRASIKRQLLLSLADALRAVGRTREASERQRQVLVELESTGYQGSGHLPAGVSYLTSSLFELGELATVDSVVGEAIRSQSRIPGQYSSGLLTFLHGLARLRMGDLDSADAWMRRAMRDTTEGAGGLSAYLPPAMTQLLIEQGRIADARKSLAGLPSGTLTRRVNRAWFTARVRHGEGDVAGAASMLEDSLRVLIANAAKPPPALAMPLVTAAEWRLAAGEMRKADSLARLARAAAGVDSAALQRSAYAGRAEFVLARALASSGTPADARIAAERAVIALSNGYGPSNPHTVSARAFRDTLAATSRQR